MFVEKILKMFIRNLCEIPAARCPFSPSIDPSVGAGGQQKRWQIERESCDLSRQQRTINSPCPLNTVPLYYYAV